MTNLAKQLQERNEQTVQVKTRKVIKKSRFSAGERLLALIFFVAVFAIAIKIVSYQASIYEVNKEIQSLNTQIEEQVNHNDELQIQVSELNTYERIWAKANELGLMLNEKNVKVVQ